MKLDKTLNPFFQMEVASKNGVAIVADLLGERMGDKAAFVHVAAWMAKKSGCHITLYEASGQGMSDFCLKDYEHLLAPLNLSVAQLPQGTDVSMIGLDIHTLGLGWLYESLWNLNALLHIRQDRVEFENTVEQTDDVVFCLLDEVMYNERRKMDVRCAADMIYRLRERANVRVVGTKSYEGVLPIEILPFEEALKVVLGARVVISGDTGFSHVSALFGKPLVAMYPDWIGAGMPRMSKNLALADWWDEPLQSISPIFVPNAKNGNMKVVEIGTDHRWSIELVMESVTTLLRPTGGLSKPPTETKKPLIYIP